MKSLDISVGKRYYMWCNGKQTKDRKKSEGMGVLAERVSPEVHSQYVQDESQRGQYGYLERKAQAVLKMREIKFRAWDRKDKCWAGSKSWGGESAFSIDFEGNITVAEDFDNNIIDWVGENRRYIPCQYTGLKDKNGKEIYEGDILKHEPIVHKVVWEDCQFVFKWGDNLPSHRLAEVYANIYEVIGNIWENPELLEK